MPEIHGRSVMGVIDEDNARERDIALRPARSSGGPYALKRPVSTEGGYPFKISEHTTKRDADRKAAWMRRGGFTTRVSKEGGMWVVYTTGDTHDHSNDWSNR